MSKPKLPLYENGNFWIRAAEFGSGRLRPKSKGYEVLHSLLTHSVVVCSIGGDFEHAKAECDRRAGEVIE
jgi:hypothetical protein